MEYHVVINGSGNILMFRVYPELDGMMQFWGWARTIPDALECCGGLARIITKTESSARPANSGIE